MQRRQQKRLLLLFLLPVSLASALFSLRLVAAVPNHQGNTFNRIYRSRITAITGRVGSETEAGHLAPELKGRTVAFALNVGSSSPGSNSKCNSNVGSRSRLCSLSEWQQASPSQQGLVLRQQLQQLQRQHAERIETKRPEQQQRLVDQELRQIYQEELEASSSSCEQQQQQQPENLQATETQQQRRQSQHRKPPAQQHKSASFSSFDVAVLGGGHAGVEAAVAASRLGLSAALISPNGFDSLGLLSCNPSIGGSGKSHLVCETDACGGLIGRAADLAAVHWRVLNVSRGPAAWAPRVQIARRAFARCIRRFVGAIPNITVIDGAAEDILTEQQQQQQQQQVWGVRLQDGTEIAASAVVVAAGTFLDACVAVGSSKAAGGRMHSVAEAAQARGQLQQQQHQHQQQQQQLPLAIEDVEPAAKGLAASLQSLGLRTTYFKTGTPARLLGSSIDFEKLQRQPSDPTPRPFSAGHTSQQLGARRGTWIDCFLGKTGEKTKEIVKKFECTLPTHRGDQGRGVGPRYCPSIANKIRLFPHNPSHVVWLEPEDSSLSVIYPGGLSGAFPPDVQQQLLHSVPGLEMAKPIRFAYDVEYLVVKGTDVEASLETKPVRGLFLAGQVLGTTGYEEAAALGLLAGWNAGLYVLSKRIHAPLRGSSDAQTSAVPKAAADTSDSSSYCSQLPHCVVLDPFKSMIGAVAQQLTARDATEPLRAFAARVPSRLSVRCDNAADRMLDQALHGGLFNKQHQRVKRTRKRREYIAAIVDIIRRFELPASRWRFLIDRAIATLENQHQQQQQQQSAANDSVSPNATDETVGATVGARVGEMYAAASTACGMAESVSNAGSAGANIERDAYVQLIEAPSDLLLLGLQSWSSAVGNGGRRWSAAQLLGALPPALTKLEQGRTNTTAFHAAAKPQAGLRNAVHGDILGTSELPTFSNPHPKAAQLDTNHPHLARDCVALQLLVALVLQHLMASNASNSTIQQLLCRCLSPSFGEQIASTVYAEIRYSFYIQREAREAAATESDEAMPVDLSMEEYPFLCREEVDCLRRFRPRTFKEAARLGCLRPASALQLMRKRRLKRGHSSQELDEQEQ